MYFIFPILNKYSFFINKDGTKIDTRMNILGAKKQKMFQGYLSNLYDSYISLYACANSGIDPLHLIFIKVNVVSIRYF